MAGEANNYNGPNWRDDPLENTAPVRNADYERDALKTRIRILETHLDALIAASEAVLDNGPNHRRLAFDLLASATDLAKMVRG